MARYRLSQAAKEDLIRIHHYGVRNFGMVQADKYFNSFFICFEAIAERPYSFEAMDYIKEGYRRCLCGSDNIYFRINGEFADIMTIVGRQDISLILK